MSRIVQFFDGAQSETTPTIGNIIASGIITYPDDATYEATEQNAPQAGNIYFNTTTNFLRYYNGTGWIDIVDDESLQTIINKTIDADLNTITNIDNDEIKAGAAIDVTKLHDGSVDNTEFGYLDGVTSSIQPQLDAKQETSQKGQPNGYAELDGTGKVPVSQLPLDDVDNVDEFADFASFPGTGVTDRIYIAADTNITYRWTGSQYVQVGSSVEELSDLTDVDTTGVQDGNLLQYNQSNLRFEPIAFDPNTVVQENIALVGAGNATWNLPTTSNQDAAQSLTDTNDFAIGPNIRTGFTFTSSLSGDLVSVQTKIVDRGLGNGDGNLTGFIYATSAGAPTGAALAQSSNSVATTNYTNVTNTVVDSNFNFGAVSLVSGTEYYFAFESSDTGSLVCRRGNVDEATSANYTEDSADSDTFSLNPVQETIYHNVLVGAAVGGLVLDSVNFISVPPLADDRHEIAAQTVTLLDGECAHVTIDRSAASAQVLSVSVSDITSVTPDNDIIILARRVGDECYFGLKDPTRISDGETVEVQKGGGGFTTVFEQNTIETKVLSTNVTSDGTIPEISFTNLVVGKKYTLRGQAFTATDSGAANTGIELRAVHNGTVICSAGFNINEASDSATDNRITAFHGSFTASSTSLDLTSISATATSPIVGDGTRATTFVELETRNDLDTNVVDNDDLALQTVKAKAFGAVTALGDPAVTVVHPTKEYDTHGTYNTTTGEFTAPRDGKLEITTHYISTLASSTLANRGVSAEIYVNGVQINSMAHYRYQVAGQTLQPLMGGTTTIPVVKDDVITVRMLKATSIGAATLVSNSIFNYTTFEMKPDFNLYGVVDSEFSFDNTATLPTVSYNLSSPGTVNDSYVEWNQNGNVVTLKCGIYHSGFSSNNFAFFDMSAVTGLPAPILRTGAGWQNSWVGSAGVGNGGSLLQPATCMIFNNVGSPRIYINTGAANNWGEWHLEITYEVA